MECSNLPPAFINYHSFLCSNTATSTTTTIIDSSNPNLNPSPNPKPNSKLQQRKLSSAYDYSICNSNTTTANYNSFNCSWTAFPETESSGLTIGSKDKVEDAIIVSGSGNCINYCSSLITENGHSQPASKRTLHYDCIAEKRIRANELDDGGGEGDADTDISKKKKLQLTMKPNSLDDNNHSNNNNNIKNNISGNAGCMSISTTTNNSNGNGVNSTSNNISNNGKRGKNSSTSSSDNNNQILHCQVEGCNEDLSKARKDYHRRHKVCEMHSKAQRVIKSGFEQRFCQQCSRFHALSEFDENKRSCRRRLEGHNKRRRKPNPHIGFIQAGNLLLHPILGMYNTNKLHLNQLMMQHQHHHQLVQLMCPSGVTWEHDQTQCQQQSLTTCEQAITNCLANGITSKDTLGVLLTNMNNQMKTNAINNDHNSNDDEGLSSSSSSSPSLLDNNLSQSRTLFRTYGHSDIQGGTRMNIHELRNDHDDDGDGVIKHSHQTTKVMPSCALSLLSRPLNKTIQLNMAPSNDHQEQLTLINAHQSLMDNDHDKAISSNQMVNLVMDDLIKPGYFNDHQRSSLICGSRLTNDESTSMKSHIQDDNQATLITQKLAYYQNQMGRAPVTFYRNCGDNMQSIDRNCISPNDLANIGGLINGASEQSQHQGNFNKHNLFYLQNLHAHLSSLSST